MIGIEEISVDEVGAFWDLHIKYLLDDGIIQDEEDIEYFSGGEYRNILEEHMVREQDRHHMAYFVRNETRIGAVSYCIYRQEGGKCFFWTTGCSRNTEETARDTDVLKPWKHTQKRMGRSIMNSTARRKIP